ncbi:Endonuclease/exonuclease/phosphatase superfamily [Sesbania bispinosa]|nr:Endonuclease/exonuclease/phosphatase superfamily [Sesbania bispinosa]
MSSARVSVESPGSANPRAELSDQEKDLLDRSKKETESDRCRKTSTQLVGFNGHNISEEDAMFFECIDQDMTTNVADKDSQQQENGFLGDPLCPVVRLTEEERRWIMPKARMEILDLDNEYFIIRFEDLDDLQHVFNDVGNVLGKTMKIDVNTLREKNDSLGEFATERAKFARICIEARVNVNNDQAAPTQPAVESPVDDSSFGPWMLVQKSFRRNLRDNNGVRGDNIGPVKEGSNDFEQLQKENKSPGSRFSVLFKDKETTVIKKKLMLLKRISLSFLQGLFKMGICKKDHVSKGGVSVVLKENPGGLVCNGNTDGVLGQNSIGPVSQQKRRMGLNLKSQGVYGCCGGMGVCFLHVLCDHAQFIHARVVPLDETSPWLLTSVYASPRPNIREDLCCNLASIANLTLEAWVVIGDFNYYLHPEEKHGGALPNERLMSRFRSILLQCGLFDLGFVGPPFTWEWSGIKERLDRGVVGCRIDLLKRLSQGHGRVIQLGWRV